MEETVEVYDQYFDKYDKDVDFDSFYEYFAEKDDMNWEDNCDE